MSKGKVRKSFREHSVEQQDAFEARFRRTRENWRCGYVDGSEDSYDYSDLEQVQMLPAQRFSPAAWLAAAARAPEVLVFVDEAITK